MTRRQLRSVLLLHDGLIAAAGLAREDARAVLRAVMLASGARFVAHFQPALTPQGWAAAAADQRSRYASDLVARLFNASVDQVRAEAASLAFDVVACRFVSLLRELDRLEFAPLFCEVDDAFAAMPGSYLKLDRTGTIATGALRCDFRLRFRDAPPE